MQPSIRKPLGILLILAGLAVYGLLIASFADTLGGLAKPVQALIYLILGVAWLLPLRPLLVWMNK
jgi:predicted membrane channel-forming protein YqfA (hemolysin III family)